MRLAKVSGKIIFSPKQSLAQVPDILLGLVHTPGVLLHTQDTEAPTEADDELLEEALETIPDCYSDSWGSIWHSIFPAEDRSCKDGIYNLNTAIRIHLYQKIEAQLKKGGGGALDV